MGTQISRPFLSATIDAVAMDDDFNPPADEPIPATPTALTSSEPQPPPLSPSRNPPVPALPTPAPSVVYNTLVHTVHKNIPINVHITFLTDTVYL